MGGTAAISPLALPPRSLDAGRRLLRGDRPVDRARPLLRAAGRQQGGGDRRYRGSEQSRCATRADQRLELARPELVSCSAVGVGRS
ncbi:MAG: hypothetical protein EDQ89_02005 [Acidobacteria bacterium]|nr:MAG: hypothetical protein EDQ89_02005 [Acidobacteriota bacterium]